MLIYSAQSSVVNPEPQGLSVWVTITEDDGLQRSCHLHHALSLADKHVNVEEASSRGQKRNLGKCVQTLPGDKSFHLDGNSILQPESWHLAQPESKLARRKNTVYPLGRAHEPSCHHKSQSTKVSGSTTGPLGSSLSCHSLTVRSGQAD